MKAVVVLKGGAGSGFYGHAGIPGHKGGSLPRGVNNYKLSQYDIITGNVTRAPDPKDVEILEDSINLVLKTVPSLDLTNMQFTLSPVIMGNVVGAYTKYYNGVMKDTKVIAIAPSRVQRAIDNNRETLNSWSDIQEPLTYESYMRHSIIHEIGHKYWEDNNLSVKWKFGYKFSTASGYSQYYKDEKEAFADAFAGFVLGYTMDPIVEEWFMENVK